MIKLAPGWSKNQKLPRDFYFLTKVNFHTTLLFTSDMNNLQIFLFTEQFIWGGMANVVTKCAFRRHFLNPKLQKTTAADWTRCTWALELDDIFGAWEKRKKKKSAPSLKLDESKENSIRPSAPVLKSCIADTEIGAGIL